MEFDRKETILDNLMARTKAEIDDLRKLLDADVKSNLNKAEMAKQLADYILHEGEFWIRRFPKRDVLLMQKLSELPKGSKLNIGHQPYATLLEMLGLIHGESVKTGERVYYATDEMRDAFKRGIHNAEAAMCCMNYPMYERYVMGLTNLYGVVPYTMVYDTLMEVAKSETSDFDRMRNPHAFAHESLLMDFYTMSVNGKLYVISPTIDHPEEVFAEQQERIGFIKDYKKFTLSEIYEAGSETDFPFVGEETSEGKRITEMLEKLGMDEDMSSYLKYAFWRFGQDTKINIITDIMQMCNGLFRSIEELNGFLQAVTAYQNSMPKWCLLGRSSDEVQRSTRNIKPKAKDGKIYS